MIVYLLGCGALGYAALALGLAGCQTWMIFPATRGPLDETPADVGWDFEDVRLEVMGETTHGWFLPVDGARGTVLFSHGNGGNLALWMYAMPVYRRLGLNVLLYDYGGYGLSTGRPSERRCYADARAMWNHLVRHRGVPPQEIVLIGRSLGSAVTAELALETKPAAVVLESPFLSMADMAREVFPILPGRLMVRHRFDTESKIDRIDAPLLILHSPKDELVPYRHGRRLYERAREPKVFVDIEGGHNDCFGVSEAIYESALDEFLGPLLPER